MVLCDELIASVRRFMEGTPVDGRTLAMDCIQEVGDGLPDRIFVDRQHTMDNYLKEQWQPQVFNRNNFQIWTDKGAKYTHQVCKRKGQVDPGEPQAGALPDDVLNSLEEIAQAATDPATLAVGKTAKAKRRRKFRVA